MSRQRKLPEHPGRGLTKSLYPAGTAEHWGDGQSTPHLIHSSIHVNQAAVFKGSHFLPQAGNTWSLLLQALYVDCGVTENIENFFFPVDLLSLLFSQPFSVSLWAVIYCSGDSSVPSQLCACCAQDGAPGRSGCIPPQVHIVQATLGCFAKAESWQESTGLKENLIFFHEQHSNCSCNWSWHWETNKKPSMGSWQCF